jgi:hypothetical protein
MVMTGWKNKGGTGPRSCKCGTWKRHWQNFTKKSWPSECFVSGCRNAPILGAHIFIANVDGEWIAPFCDSCNKLGGSFNLKTGVDLVSANQQKTCDQ